VIFGYDWKIGEEMRGIKSEKSERDGGIVSGHFP